MIQTACTGINLQMNFTGNSIVPRKYQISDRLAILHGRVATSALGVGDVYGDIAHGQQPDKSRSLPMWIEGGGGGGFVRVRNESGSNH
jgi:hypothetical protein